MEFIKIVEELKKVDPSLKFRVSNNTDISALSFYSNNKKFDGNTLYIMRSSQAVSLNNEPEINSLIINNGDTQTDISHRNHVIISNSIDIYTLFEQINCLFLQEERLLQDKQKLLKAFNSGIKMNQLLEYVHTLIENPIIVVDNSFRIIAVSSDFVDYRPDLKKQKELGYVLIENIDFLKKRNSLEDASQAKKEKNNKEWLFKKIYMENIEIAHLAIIGNNKELDWYTHQIADFVSVLFSYVLSKESVFRNNRGMLHNYFLNELLNNEIKQLSTLEYRLQQIEWRPDNFFIVGIIFDATQELSNTKVEMISYHLKQLFPNCIWTIFHDRVVMLITSKDNQLSSLQRNKDLKLFLSNNRLNILFSDFFTSLLDTNYFYNQSESTLKTFEKKENGHIFLYDDHKLDYLLSIVQKEHKLESFCYQKIISVRDYDLKNNTSFIKTLSAYIENVNNPTVAAEKLFIHKNTLFYRINRIKDLFSINLDSGDERFKISWTLKLLSYIENH